MSYHLFYKHRNKRKFEIGVVYLQEQDQRKDIRLLAISEDTLIRYDRYKKKWVKTKKQRPYIICRNYPVERLCKDWGITDDELNEMSDRELYADLKGPRDSEPSYRTAQRRQNKFPWEPKPVALISGDGRKIRA